MVPNRGRTVTFRTLAYRTVAIRSVECLDMTQGVLRASSRGARIRWRVAAGVLSAVLAASPAPVAWAAGGGGGHSAKGDSDHGSSAASTMETPPRTKAQGVGGRYMQLNVLWLPVVQKARHRYQAVTARLVPHPAKRVMACFKAPWAQEALLFALNESPLTLDAIASWQAESAPQRLMEREDAQDRLFGALRTTESRTTDEAAEKRRQAEAFKQNLLNRIHQHVGVSDLYVDILVVSGMPPPDGSEEMLSRMCR